MSAESREARRGQIRRYWEAHPLATQNSELPPGSDEFFDGAYRRWLSRMDPARERFLAECRDRKVLEIGCGIAVLGHHLMEQGGDYQAVDLSRRSLRLARRWFERDGLDARFANADAAALPFRDESFGMVVAIGILHHVPDWRRACREVVRVTAPGGRVRVMLYNRRSYHYALVHGVVRPLVWLLLRLPAGLADRLARLGPAKLRALLEISRRHGFDARRLLDASTDASQAGEGDFNPQSGFVSEAELREAFEGLEEQRFERRDLKYYPFPFRGAVERRWGFFLTMTARKPG